MYKHIATAVFVPVMAAVVHAVAWSPLFAHQPATKLACDLPSAGGDLGYQRRPASARCEGLFISPVSTRLDLVSLQAAPMHFPLQPQVRLQVIPLIRDLRAAIQVRAVAIPPKVYYQMDAVVDPMGSPLVWPVRDVLLPLHLDDQRLGIFGWTGTDHEKTYVPLWIRQQDNTTQAAPDHIELKVRAPFDAERVLWRLYSADRPPSPLPPWEPVASTVAAYQPVTVILPPGGAQILRVDIEVKERNLDYWEPLHLRVYRPALPWR